MTVVAITYALVIVTVGYLFFVALLSRRAVEPPGELDPSLFYIFFVPALNEERVIANTLDSLMALPADRTLTIVIDDGSTDRTAQIVRTYPPKRVQLFQRVAPDAQLGKGAALNATYRHVVNKVRAGADRVAICVVDADGRLEPDVLDHVDPILRTPGVGALQLMVRIFNRKHLLTRFQDFEFVSFSALLQRGRQHLGSVGLGGNGQFVRLRALQDLGDNPWSDCLTEDLDLGIRLAVAGWDNRFTSSSVVSQQGVRNLGVLLRQRTRWIHGHMQCWKLIPDIIRSDLTNRTVMDLLYYLAAPLILALASVLFTVPLVVLAIGLFGGFAISSVTVPVVAGLVVWYLVAFAPAILLGAAYNRTARDVSLARSMVLSHLLLAYNYIWYAAVWRAFGRIAFRRRGWVKTARHYETSAVDDSLVPGLVSGGVS